MKLAYEGGCTCGNVRYHVHAKPLIVHACHCRWCQRETGGPHVINALFEADLVEVTSGQVENCLTDSPSGKGQIIARCPNCKIAVWSNYDFSGMREQVRFLRVGTLDNPDVMPPDIHIYTSSKVPWYLIPKDQMAVEEYYDTSTTWSAESLQRLSAWKRKVESQG